MSGDIVHNMRVSRTERRIGRVWIGSDSSVRSMPQADEATSIKERAVLSCVSHVPGVGLHLVTSESAKGVIGDDECEHAKVLATTRTFVALLSGFGGRDGERKDRFRAGAKDADLRHRT